VENLLVDAVVEGRFPARKAKEFILETVKVLELRVARGPIIKWRGEEKIAFALLQESHIAISVHGTQCFIDIFSCKDFSVGRILDLIESMLPVKVLRAQAIQRNARLQKKSFKLLSF